MCAESFLCGLPLAVSITNEIAAVGKENNVQFSGYAT